MSHELRTPLNAILGFSEIIRDRVFGDQATPRYAAYAADIHGSGTHVLSLISDILDLSRIDAGKRDLDEEPVAVSEICDAVMRLHAHQAMARGVQLSCDNQVTQFLFADSKAVTQILVNLVSNSLKFTPTGGTVSLRAWCETGEICLAVNDNGLGIAAEDLGRVNERFGQAQHDIAAPTGKGVGLGLPIVKGLAEAHGAVLTITSDVGHGTRVVLRFPAARAISSAKAA